MRASRTVADWMNEKGLDGAQLVAATGLDEKVVAAIVACRYTTSPQQRKRIADALGIDETDIQWGGGVDVDPMYGHGPQFGRSP